MQALVYRTKHLIHTRSSSSGSSNHRFMVSLLHNSSPSSRHPHIPRGRSNQWLLGSNSRWLPCKAMLHRISSSQYRSMARSWALQALNSHKAFMETLQPWGCHQADQHRSDSGSRMEECNLMLVWDMDMPALVQHTHPHHSTVRPTWAVAVRVGSML